jgi:hypothetical protein
MVDVAVPWRLRRPIMLLHDYHSFLKMMNKMADA